MSTASTDPAISSTTEGTDGDGPSLADRLLRDALGTLELFGVYLGEQLGLYDALRRSGPLTEAQLSQIAGIAPRYAREWLEQQAVAGVLDVEDPTDRAPARRYHLPARNVGAVADPDHPDHLAPFARMVVGIARVLDEVAAAYRSGGGVPYARYGADFRSGQGAINRPAFRTALVDEWLPAVGGLVERLEAGGRLADLGCGQGWSTTAIAAAFPRAEVWGIDADVASIEEARALAADQGTTVRFEAADAAELAGHGPFDAVLVLEALHDVARPVELLAGARAALADGGAVIVADEAVAPTFTAPGDELERLMYGWSISHCLPASMAEQPSAAIGTVIRPSTVAALAAEAGFTRCEVLDVDGGFFRLYRLAG